MAITGIDYLLWESLRDDDLLPHRPAVLEVGQANWYGDTDPALIADDVRKYADHADVDALLARLATGDSFEQAEVFYAAVLRFRSILAIDMHGTDRARPHDLNLPLPPSLAGPYDVVINTGTAEHVFDQRQLWQTFHDATAPGGLMVHSLPLWGWLDHGFYNLHPTFVADVAAANGYKVVRWWVGDYSGRRYQPVGGPGGVHEYARRYGTGGTAMQHVALKKTADAPFVVPMQGYYQGSISPELAADWKTMR